MFVATLDMFFLPAVTYAAKHTSPCSDWLVFFRLKSMLDIYHDLSYKHPRRIARVCSLPLYISYLGAE